MRIVILSCPKTGNTWLRWLLHHAYRLPMIELAPPWTDQHATGELPGRFVTHHHFPPTERLVRWLSGQNVVVLTTIRHPADTLLSYFHFAKWAEISGDPALAMKADGDVPGQATLAFAGNAFAQTYAISLQWRALGALVVKYEDLLENPLAQLRALSGRIGELPDEHAKIATLLSRPDQLAGSGKVDRRHFRTASSRRWVHELPENIVEALMRNEACKGAAELFGYDWDRTRGPSARFDYASIDPFHGAERFDNGEPVTAALLEIFLREEGTSSARWPDPTVTAGDSFWNWLRAPSIEAMKSPDYPSGTLTNLMRGVYRLRADAQAAFPDPIARDRIGFLEWFVARAPVEYDFPAALMAPPVEAREVWLVHRNPQ